MGKEARIANPVMVDAAGALKVELGYAIACALLFLWIILDTRKRGELKQASLCAIAGLSMFWQEFYADWGAYLLWSEEFHMLPWGESKWTTPDKPWKTVAAYPVFMCLSISLMLLLCRTALKFWPQSNRQLICFFTASITLIIINTGLELAAVSSAGAWTYIEVFGPAIETSHGLQPLLYPNLPFGAWGGVICALILTSDIKGYPLFEGIARAHKRQAGWRREAARALAWIVVWNISYWLILCTPLITMRELLGNPNPLVP